VNGPALKEPTVLVAVTEYVNVCGWVGTVPDTVPVTELMDNQDGAPPRLKVGAGKPLAVKV
jgi:hypothetical protein